MSSRTSHRPRSTVPHDLAILTRVLEPGAGGLSRSVAQALLGFQFTDRDVRRMNALSRRARAGLLTRGESEELDSYERVGHLLAILQSKARKSLRKRPAS